MDNFLNSVTDHLAPIIKSPMGVLTILVAIVAAYCIKILPYISNRIIPLVIVCLSAFVFWRIGDRTLVPPGVNDPDTVLALWGVVLGFMAWGAEAAVLRKFGIVEHKIEEVSKKTETIISNAVSGTNKP